MSKVFSKRFDAFGLATFRCKALAARGGTVNNFARTKNQQVAEVSGREIGDCPKPPLTFPFSHRKIARITSAGLSPSIPDPLMRVDGSPVVSNAAAGALSPMWR